MSDCFSTVWHDISRRRRRQTNSIRSRVTRLRQWLDRRLSRSRPELGQSDPAATSELLKRNQPISPLKVVDITIKPDKTVISMVPPSFKSDSEMNDENGIIYPEDVTDRRPYQTVARFRKAMNQSTNFHESPLVVADDSPETLLFGLESFAQQHGCDLSLSGEDEGFCQSIDRAACGVVDLGSIHMLAMDALLTANFQFTMDLDYDRQITSSKENVEKFVLDFCKAISNVLSCENNNVSVFSIEKLDKKPGRSRVNFGLTTSDQKTTEQLASSLQHQARTGFETDAILKHVKQGEYECTWKSVVSYLRLQPLDLASEFNFDYRKSGLPKELMREGYPYHLPLGWYRHALKVRDKYGDDTTWIGRVNANGEWPIAYHGTKHSAVSGIVEHGLLYGTVKRDAMLNEAIRQMGKKANAPGLYVATHCDDGAHPKYTEPFSVPTSSGKSEQFCIVFQCRVEPGQFTTHKEPVDVGEAWRIVDPKAIRPYGILLKKERPQPTSMPSREERFMLDPIAPKRPCGGEYGWVSPFIKEVRKYLNLKVDESPSQDSSIVSMIVEKAALGIIEEGKFLKELHEAEKMAELLRAQKNQGILEIWRCCARLYSMENFLYKTLNAIMRDIGSEEHENIWRSKIGTLGPFCFLLWDCPFHNRLTKKLTLYRGLKLTDEQIDTYQKMCGLPHEYRSFQAFTSCSRNRSRAEQFGNVLFIMEIQRAFTVDLTPTSVYPDEEEELISPGVCFNVRQIEFDKDKNKYLFYLTVNQRFNRKLMKSILPDNGFIVVGGQCQIVFVCCSISGGTSSDSIANSLKCQHQHN
ncbi:unnamed protein product [Rotaria magnacalcarata]|uniref:NAD(P)(+)--arginine ADP-ribosyltransferase n=2 Tax=Rotaria magnacalcarata TaxID=392030 RepID=A0A819UB54_9BILA|nr:unnamed protein product [Rotaria magnacalcarata]